MAGPHSEFDRLWDSVSSGARAVEVTRLGPTRLCIGRFCSAFNHTSWQ